MKTMKWILVCAALCLLGCATMRPGQVATGFLFDYEGTKYQINSLSPRDLVGYNTLTQRDGEDILMNAIDLDQDGNIDEIIKGEQTLDEIQKIYALGIELAKEKGSYYHRTLNRTYQTFDSNFSYTLQTYALAVGETYNKLIIRHRWLADYNVVAVDEKADGSLNGVKEGVDQLAKYQKIYDSILEQGLRDGKISMSREGIYQVACGIR